MTISARIEADSISTNGVRLTTFVLKYHRFVHSELMTHRVFSRNASSSRAIPVKRMIKWVKEDPAIPVSWGKNQKGMQAGDELSSEDQAKAELIWLQARDDAIKHTDRLVELGVHKQIANRVLEPWHHISVIVSATQFANWFTLRWHKDAQPEIKVLAEKMADLYRNSDPKLLHPGEWHLPFIRDEEKDELNLEDQIKSSVARSARVSYNNHDGSKPNIENDIKLHDMLVVARPLHASPAEHQATPLSDGEPNSKLSGNFHGWKQYRKTLSNECSEVLPWDVKEI